MESGEHVIEFDCECRECDGTGLYVGAAENDGAAVVCYRCKGAGKQHVRTAYREFTGRRDRDGAIRVFEVNPGICIGTGNGQFELSDFGGMPYADRMVGMMALIASAGRTTEGRL